MITVEKKNDGTIEVWHYESDINHSVRVCTHPDKLAATLPRDELVMIRKLVNELDRLLPKEPVLTWTMDSVDTAPVDSTLTINKELSPAADGRLERV